MRRNFGVEAGFEGPTLRRQRVQASFLARHADSSGKSRPDLWQPGIEHQRAMRFARGGGTGHPSLGGPNALGTVWRQIGPAPLRIDSNDPFQGPGPVSGEVVDIAIDPSYSGDQVLYIATNDGGVWKSVNGGNGWMPKTDYRSSLSMGAVALAPGDPSTVYTGTGNAYDGGGLFTKGVGIYRSIDGGETWSDIGTALFTNLSIKRIVLPGPDVLLVATNYGLHRSTDGGRTWSSPPVLFGDVTDLARDTTVPSTIYAAVSGQGVYRSTDYGATFPTNLFTSSNGAPAAPYERIRIAQSMRPDNQSLYASVASGSAFRGYKGLYKSTNYGATWTLVAPASTLFAGYDPTYACACWYSLTLGVDPWDANWVYAGFEELLRSTDGGASFNVVTHGRVHWDHHAIAFSPNSTGVPARLYVGTDGGIASSGDGGASWSNLNEGLASILFKGIDIGRWSPASNAYTYGGAQDTGTSEQRPGFSGSDWHQAMGGDGGPVAVDPTDPSRAYGSVDGDYIVTGDAGGSWSRPTGTGLPDGGPDKLFAVDPNDHAVVYAAAGGNLYRSSDVGAHFTQMTSFPAAIASIASVKTDSNRLWVGLVDGGLQRTSTAGLGPAASWYQISVTGAPGLGIGAVAVDPFNSQIAVVVYTGFSGIAPPNRSKHAFMTATEGASWTDVSGTDGAAATNLPDLPLHSVVIAPGLGLRAVRTLIVASDAGVMRSVDEGRTWHVLGVGLPTVDSRSLGLDTSVNPALLRVGTYGRSVFELTSPVGPLLAVEGDLGFGYVCIGAQATRQVRLLNVGSSDVHITSISPVRSLFPDGKLSFPFRVSGPAPPLTVAPGGEVDYQVTFRPLTSGNHAPAIQISYDQQAQRLPISGTGGC